MSRETYKADEILQKGERDKQDQDRLVLHLQHQLDIQNARLAKLNVRTHEEVGKADAVKESMKEIDDATATVEEEIKMLVKHWKQGVANLQKGDECLQVKEKVFNWDILCHITQ